MTPLIEMKNLSIIRGATPVLKNMNFSLNSKEHVALLGPNGCGKSTLIQAITRDLYPVEAPGMVFEIKGQRWWDVAQLRKYLGIVTLEMQARHTRRQSVRDTVLSGYFSSIGLWPHHQVTDAMHSKTSDLLNMLRIQHLDQRLMTEVSSGEARRALIARALVHEPEALLLDEPTTSLDLRVAGQFRATMRQLAGQGVTIILVTHNSEDIIPEIKRTVLLKDGKIVLDGTTEDVLTSSKLSEIFDAQVEVRRVNETYFTHLVSADPL